MDRETNVVYARHVLQNPDVVQKLPPFARSCDDIAWQWKPESSWGVSSVSYNRMPSYSKSKFYKVTLEALNVIAATPEVGENPEDKINLLPGTEAGLGNVAAIVGEQPILRQDVPEAIVDVEGDGDMLEGSSNIVEEGDEVAMEFDFTDDEAGGEETGVASVYDFSDSD